MIVRSQQSIDKWRYDAQVLEGRAKDAHAAAQAAQAEADQARRTLEELAQAEQQLHAQLRDVAERKNVTRQLEQVKRGEAEQREAEHRDYLNQAADARDVLRMAGVEETLPPAPSGEEH